MKHLTPDDDPLGAFLRDLHGDAWRPAGNGTYVEPPTADTARLLSDDDICKQVAALLVDKGFNAYAEHMGGGIICVLVDEAHHREWVFGMSNTEWDGNLTEQSTGELYEGQNISTDVASDSQNPQLIADAIADGIRMWRNYR